MRDGFRKRRIERLRERMDAEGIRALLVTQREALRYLTGFTGSSGQALITPRRVFLVTDFRYRLQAGRETSGATIVIQKKDAVAALRETAGRAGARKLWYDESSLTVAQVKALGKSGLRLAGSKDLVAELRQIKDARELASIRLAVRRAEESFLELKATLKPGVPEREIALRLESLMKERGSRRVAFDTIVASGRNGAMPHASVSNRKIKRGDLVTIDFGAEADGYFCDITRTFCIGRPTPRQREIHALVLKAQQAAVESVRIGASCRDIDAAARGVISAAGYGKQFGHATGHGIGLMVHERPSLSRLSNERIEKEMIFTVEPGIYLEGWGGVRIEDMVLVAKNGAKLLTSLPREL